ncbi:hypothetical protein BD311DRAFT_48176 [Dichomitus squalens]|uniref:Uncharacterized protein n=1 Tax=Dichomitus squalens TaxID=114155 RepID=A0A4Q9M9T1_9APHY|nr:hypothetical protein BD311DRAFT_48176 [Dichomitus squalens]
MAFWTRIAEHSCGPRIYPRALGMLYVVPQGRVTNYYTLSVSSKLRSAMDDVLTAPNECYKGAVKCRIVFSFLIYHHHLCVTSKPPFHYDLYDNHFLTFYTVMAAHRDRRPRRPSVTFGNDTIYFLSPRDEPLSVVSSPQYAPAEQSPHAQSFPAFSSISHPGAVQRHTEEIPRAPPGAGASARLAHSANHASQYNTGSADRHVPSAASRFVDEGYRSLAGRGYLDPTPTPTNTPLSCPAPLLQNRSLPSTPSETPLSRSPHNSPPDSPHARSSSSWGTPSPEPDGNPGSNSDISPHLQKPTLRWDLRGDRLQSLDVRPWFDEPAFLSRRTSCELIFEADGKQWRIQVPERRRGRPVTIGDVLSTIDAHVWDKLDVHNFHVNRSRLELADAERSYRYLGAEDSHLNVFRYVDLFAEEKSNFSRLEDADKPGAFLVVIGSSSSA